MEIGIIGSNLKVLTELEKEIKKYLNNSNYNIRYFKKNQINTITSKEDLVAVFIVIDNIESLYILEKIVNLKRNLPMIVVSNDPQYALECLRLDVRHYILLPLESEEIKKTLIKLGVIV